MMLASFTFDSEQKLLRIEMKVGQLDAAVATDFREQLTAHWPQQAPASVEIDLGAVTFIDSSGIGSLIAISKKLGQRGALVSLRNVHPQVRSVIELLRLQSLFRVL